MPRFDAAAYGNQACMLGGSLGIGIALIVAGAILLFIIPFVGIAAGILGIVIVGAYLLGIGRRAAEPRS